MGLKLHAIERVHAEVELEVHCDLSRELHQHLRSDDLDIIVAVMPTARARVSIRLSNCSP